MTVYGENTKEVERSIADAASLSPKELDEVGGLWRLYAAPHFTGPPDVNTNIAQSLLEAQTTSGVLNQFAAQLGGTAPPPSPNQIGHAMKAAADARAAAIDSLTTNEDAKTAIAAMAMVVSLASWIRRPIIENALAPFVAVKPGWLGD